MYFLNIDTWNTLCAAVQKIKQRILSAQSRRKSYADSRRKDLEFAVGDHVFLKVAPMRGVLRFGKKGLYLKACFSLIKNGKNNLGKKTCIWKFVSCVGIYSLFLACEENVYLKACLSLIRKRQNNENLYLKVCFSRKNNLGKEKCI